LRQYNDCCSIHLSIYLKRHMFKASTGSAAHQGHRINAFAAKLSALTRHRGPLFHVQTLGQSLGFFATCSVAQSRNIAQYHPSWYDRGQSLAVRRCTLPSGVGQPVTVVTISVRPLGCLAGGASTVGLSCNSTTGRSCRIGRCDVYPAPRLLLLAVAVTVPFTLL
jgi:hypothetical protein